MLPGLPKNKKKSDWVHLLSAFFTNINNGVMALTHKMWQHYWWHWQEFLPTGINPYLQDLAPSERIPVLQGFAKQVREGTFGGRKWVEAGSIQTAIDTIAKVIKLAGFANHLHRPGTTNYHTAIGLQTESYPQTNPTTKADSHAGKGSKFHLQEHQKTGRSQSASLWRT